MKLLLCSMMVLAASKVRADFIVENTPISDEGSWSQRILLSGNFDFIAFEVVSVNRNVARTSATPFDNPFSLPGITDFEDPANSGSPLTGWSTEMESAAMVTARGASSEFMSITVHFDGGMNEAMEFRGVAFLDGVQQFSANFVWGGIGAFGTEMIEITDLNSWNPDYEEVAGNLVPLPAPVWLGALGLLGVIGIHRRRTKRLAAT